MTDPYIEVHPKDLISASLYNQTQVLIRDDIARATKKAIEDIKKVPRADDADKLQGTSKEDLIKQIVDRAVAEIRAKSGYTMLFKVLKLGKERVVKHDLHLFPLVDLYQLDYFPVVCSEDDQKHLGVWTTFYLHHCSEKRLRLESGKFLEIQPTEGPVFKLLFKDLLAQYKVQYDDDNSLSDVEGEFWEAFFQAPNDCFDDNQYCHSPWFQKCCREEKTVRDAKHNGDWDDLWVQFRPRKTVNYPMTAELQNPRLATPTPAPTQVQVAQYDYDTLGLTLLTDPVTDPKLTDPEPVGSIANTIPDFDKELKLMVLLKV